MTAGFCFRWGKDRGFVDLTRPHHVLGSASHSFIPPPEDSGVGNEARHRSQQEIGPEPSEVSVWELGVHLIVGSLRTIPKTRTSLAFIALAAWDNWSTLV